MLQRTPYCLQHEANLALQIHQDEHSPRSTIQQQRVVFKTTHQVNYGEVIKVVGQGPQLGKWEVRTAPGDDGTQPAHAWQCIHMKQAVSAAVTVLCLQLKKSPKGLHVRSYGVVRRGQLVSRGGLVSWHH